MASFTGQIPDIVGGGNSLGYSQGSIADASGGSSFKMVGDLIEGVSTGVDLVTKSYLKEATLDNVDKARDTAGVYAAADTVAASDQVPPDVVAGADGISRLRKAKEAGAMSDTQYWGRLTADTQALRARFPAYRDYIDSVVSQAAGTNPANALRKALEEQAGKTSPEEKRRQELQDRILVNNPPLNVEIANIERTRGTKMSNAEIFSMYNAGQVANYNIATEQSKLSLNKDRNEAASVEAKRVTGMTFSHVEQKLMNTVMSSAGDLANITPTGLQNMTPDDVKRVSLSISGLKVNLIQQFDQELNKPMENGLTLAAMINDPAKVDALKASALGRIDALAAAVGGKDVSAIQAAANYYKMSSDVAGATLINDPKDGAYWKSVMAVRLVGGDQAAGAFMNKMLEKHVSAINDTLDIFDRRAIAGAAAGQPMSEIITSINRAPGDKKPGLIGSIFDKMTATVGNSPDLADKDVRLVSKSLFSGGTSNFAADPSIPYEQRQKLFQAATAPGVSDRFVKLGGKEKDDYLSWVKNNFTQLLAKDAENAKDIRLTNTQQTITYDENSHRLVAQQRLDTSAGNFADRLYEASPVQVNQSVDRLNRNLEGVVNVAKAAGMDKEKVNGIVLNVLAKSGFNPNSTEQQLGTVSTLFGNIGKAIKDFVTTKPDSRVPEEFRGKIAIAPSLLAGEDNLAFVGMDQNFKVGFGKMLDAMPSTLRNSIKIESAHRTAEQQQALIAAGNPRAVSALTSRHVIGGDAVDITPNGDGPSYNAALQWMYHNGPQFGIENPPTIRQTDRNHFQLLRKLRKDNQ